jgi:GNAT superfamily N-acetyltransferase
MATAFKVDVYNSNIARMHVRGGEINDEAQAITRRILPLARILSPKRTGNLARSHRRQVNQTLGVYGVRGSVRATASYARYVHRGTYGPIVARHSSYMVLRPAYRGFGVSRQTSVRGQRANPWLLEAANRVLLRYGVRAVDSGPIERI